MAYKLTLVVPEELVAKAKIKAIEEGVSVSGAVRAFFEGWVNNEIPTPAGARDERKTDDRGELTPADLAWEAA